jgi:hypothetical protein
LDTVPHNVVQAPPPPAASSSRPFDCARAAPAALSGFSGGGKSGAVSRFKSAAVAQAATASGTTARRLAGLLAASIGLAPALVFADVTLPSGAQKAWLAPKADRFAREASTLFDAAGKISLSATPTAINDLVKRETGLPLLSAAELAKAGVDVSRGWTRFERGGAAYVEVSVSDRAALMRTLDAWATSRGLRSRESNGREVLFARAKGSRAVAGYLVAKDRAVILTTPAGRRSGLEQALASVESGVPVQPPVDGSLLQWRADASFARDFWVAWNFSARGVSWKGAARSLVADWFAAKGADDWSGGMAANVDREQVLRARARLGDKGAKEIGAWFAKASGAEARTGEAVARLAHGPVELDWTGLSARTRPVEEFSSEALASLFAPVLVVTGGASGRVGTLTSSNIGSLLALGTDTAKAAPAESSGSPSLRCPIGPALFSVRVDGQSLARALDGVGLWGALRDDALRGLFAASAEFGPLLVKLAPAKVVGCRAGKGMTLEGNWLFR